jgi:hypothetical protein
MRPIEDLGDGKREVRVWETGWNRESGLFSLSRFNRDHSPEMRAGRMAIWYKGRMERRNIEVPRAHGGGPSARILHDTSASRIP